MEKRRVFNERLAGTFALVLMGALLLNPLQVWAKKKKIDIIVFAGQSNMMGHGMAEEAPQLREKAGFAYNPVTGKGRLSDLAEPFAQGENDGYFSNIYGGDIFATGSMVTSFVNAYYAKTKTPVLAVPASMLGTGSQLWADKIHIGVVKRTWAAKSAAKKAGYSVSHVYMVFLQGESDATAMQRNEDGTCESGMTEEVYIRNIKKMFKKVKKKAKVSKCMVIQIPSYLGENKDPYGTSWNQYFRKIQKAQKSLCKNNNDFVMICTKAPSLKESYFREDMIHLNQNGLNLIGTIAGRNAGKYAKKDK